MPGIITDPDVLSGFLQDESGLHGWADGVLRVRSEGEVSEAIRRCRTDRLPLLPVGCQTASTGAAVPFGGIVLSTASWTAIEDIDRARRIAVVRPGAINGDVKRAVAAEGLFFPPDPTSSDESTIGGNVASNASGARSFQYGVTGDWVAGLELMDGTGTTHRFMRRAVDKNTTGPRAFHDPVDLVVGSEGMLGIVSRVWLRLAPDPGPFFGAFLWFPTLDDALRAAVAWRLGGPPTPRCVELFDRAALGYFDTHPAPPKIPAGAGAMLFTEWDLGDRDLEAVLEDLLPTWAALGVLVDDTVVAVTAAERAWLRDLRHHVPTSNNAAAARHHDAGGLKVSTEFCVPPDRLLEVMARVEEIRREEDIEEMVRYGHVGNAHPHVFMFGRTTEEVARRKRVAHLLCKIAVAAGGTVSGEHGIGKTRRDFLRYMMPPQLRQALAETKRAFDPDWIMAPGNILHDPRGTDDGIWELEEN
ncbi:MAG: FAD-binding oxidoreductase [Pseudomonadota bacterium]